MSAVASRIATRVALCAAVCASASACSRDDEKKPRTEVFATPFNPQPTAARPPSAPDAARPPDPPFPVDAIDAAPPASTARTPAPAEADSAPPVNPDDAILARARTAAGACFASLPAGAGQPQQRSAQVTVTIVPTGRVTRAEPSSSDTNDPRVLDCLRRTAESTVFSDNGGGPLRTYVIDVRVVAK